MPKTPGAISFNTGQYLSPGAIIPPKSNSLAMSDGWDQNWDQSWDQNWGDQNWQPNGDAADLSNAWDAPAKKLVSLGPWVCACGFKNNEKNTKCGGNGPMGCDAPRPEDG